MYAIAYQYDAEYKNKIIKDYLKFQKESYFKYLLNSFLITIL